MTRVASRPEFCDSAADTGSRKPASCPPNWPRLPARTDSIGATAATMPEMAGSSGPSICPSPPVNCVTSGASCVNIPCSAGAICEENMPCSWPAAAISGPWKTLAASARSALTDSPSPAKAALTCGAAIAAEMPSFAMASVAPANTAARPPPTATPAAPTPASATLLLALAETIAWPPLAAVDAMRVAAKPAAMNAAWMPDA